MFINFQQKFSPIRLFPPILLLIFKEISHLYFYLEPSSIRNSRVSNVSTYVQCNVPRSRVLKYVSKSFFLQLSCSFNSLSNFDLIYFSLIWISYVLLKWYKKILRRKELKKKIPELFETISNCQTGYTANISTVGRWWNPGEVETSIDMVNIISFPSLVGIGNNWPTKIWPSYFYWFLRPCFVMALAVMLEAIL